MTTKQKKMDFPEAVKRSMQIRKLYHKIEKQKHGGAWTIQEDMIGFVYDVGELGRLVMAAEGRWIYQGALSKDLDDKLSECLWWLFVLSKRLGIDINTAFSSKIAELEASLSECLEDAKQPARVKKQKRG